MDYTGHLSYEKFKKLAQDPGLSKYEKIGFFNKLREGYEEVIYADIESKLSNINKKNQTVVDIGAGCSDLPLMLINKCAENNHNLILIDSKDMLDHLPDEDFIQKIPGKFPIETRAFIEAYTSKVDVVLCYSVFHYIFDSMPYFDFIDQSLGLLNEGGQFLLGDLPNFNKKNRFFESPSGIEYHKENNKTNDPPELEYNTIPYGSIDDGVIFGIMQRARNSGFESYLLPQPTQLPMSNRREDLLFIKH